MSIHSIYNDCGGYPLALGSVHGIRIWRALRGYVDGSTAGVLTAWTWGQYRWGPGENVATCILRHGFHAMGARIQHSEARLKALAAGLPLPSEPPPVPGIICARDDCGCGLWAYHDGTPHFGSVTGVVGVIEGWGKTTIGERGFRCEKARIVALAFPPEGADYHQAPELEAAIGQRYPDVPTYPSIADMLDAHPLDEPEVSRERDTTAEAGDQ